MWNIPEDRAGRIVNNAEVSIRRIWEAAQGTKRGKSHSVLGGE